MLKIVKSLLPIRPQGHRGQCLDDVLGLELDQLEKLVLRELMIKDDENAYENEFTRYSIVHKFVSCEADLPNLVHLDISRNRMTTPQITDLLNVLAQG